MNRTAVSNLNKNTEKCSSPKGGQRKPSDERGGRGLRQNLEQTPDKISYLKYRRMVGNE